MLYIQVPVPKRKPGMAKRTRWNRRAKEAKQEAAEQKEISPTPQNNNKEPIAASEQEPQKEETLKEKRPPAEDDKDTAAAGNSERQEVVEQKVGFVWLNLFMLVSYLEIHYCIRTSLGLVLFFSIFTQLSITA